MDITLERILSLIPKKPDGKFVHGALKTFANSIGLKSGNLISDWINGRSESYRGYLYEIAAKYDVSVEWLKGETDNMGGTGIPRETKAAISSASKVAGATAATGVAAGIMGPAVIPGIAAIAAIDTAGAILGKKKKPAPSGDELKRSGYDKLTEENRALIDQMIEKLLKSQSDE